MSKVFRQAQEAHRGGRSIEAANTLREALRREPNHAPSFHLLGIIEAKQGRFAVAQQCLDAAVAFEPNNARYLVDRANVIASLGRAEEAVAAYDLAIQIDPRLAEAYSNRGQALRMLGRRREALASVDKAIELKSDFIDAHALKGELLLDLSELEDAIRAYSHVLALNPAHLPALFSRGICQGRLRRWEKALKDFSLIVELVPEHTAAQAFRGHMLFELDRFSPALAAAERALSLDPKRADCHLLRGKALSKLERYDEALTAIERALELGADEASCYVARGSNYCDLRQFDKALEEYDRGIRINPDNAIWFYNRGSLLQNLRRYEEAIVNFDEAIAREPTHAASYWNAGLSYLQLGNPKGWDFYEWRWQLDKGGPNKREQPQNVPRWHGFEPIEGKNVLLTSEQGLGDSIMFCRFAHLVAERGANVTLAVPKSLARILKNVPGVKQILSRDTVQRLNGYHYYCPLLSLPKIFSMTFDNVPFGKTAYITADQQLVEQWRERLQKAGLDYQRPRVGLMWSGRVVKSLGLRSMSLETMLGLLDPAIQYVSLQKEVPEADRKLMRERGVLHFGDEQSDFADAAAIIESMDLVVSIDTSIAHLSGALGKETWVALQFSSEWRWLLDRDDSPWYPKARLFRQPRQDDWEAVIANIRAALMARFAPQAD